ncbi:MAG: bifunctional precorrin-2 dehydrogenase/sirohydrochlorin ferrochelatase [Lachnospiraceae bacterium]|nr:bifunctional precorrin-2 dehydrogenase/sirohydrochlorin ferrochelatase [Lachnospiraceae bacterium]
MSYFPFYTNIHNKTFMIIGGGTVALEKVNRLRHFTASMIVIAPHTEIEGREVEVPRRSADYVQILRREYRADDLAFADYVVAATGIREVDRGVADDCRKRKIPVNVVDDQAYCDFIFPSIVKRGPLTIAISTSGTSPAYAMQLRRELDEMLPDEIEAILDRMGEIRADVSARVSEQKTRAALYKKILARLIETGNTLPQADILRMVEQAADDRGQKEI